MIDGRKVIDYVMLNDELGMLNARFHELDDLVDYFIINEADKTFSGIDKPFYYLENKERFAKFNNKVIHLAVDGTPDTKNPFLRESFQRDSGGKVLKDLEEAGEIRDSSVILLCGVDEIPKKQSIIDFVRSEKFNDDLRYAMEMRAFFYNFKMERVGLWFCPKMFSYKYFKSVDSTLTTIIRRSDLLSITEWRREKYCVRDAGWHCGWFGTSEEIEKKMRAFSHHKEYEGCTQEYIKRKIKEGVYVKGFNNDEEVILHDELPEDLPQHRDLFIDIQYKG
jgi:beta-1,4-mannosyl-glycoprotein beta-1,4-N-acetylglucosaminyltransferase